MNAKHTMKWMLAAFLGLSLSATAAGPGMRGPGGGHGGGPGMEQMDEKMIEKLELKLDLSDVQKKELRAIRKAEKDKKKSSRDDAKDMRDEMHSLLAKPDKSEAHIAKIRAVHAKMNKIMDTKRDQHFETMLKIRSVLTEEQIVKFHELRKERMQKRKDGKKLKKGRGEGRGKDS